MKGIVFIELFDLVESAHGYELVDRLIEKCELENDGAYTAVGTYTCSELIGLVVELSQELDVEIPVLIKMFGGHLFGKFMKGYSELLRYENAFDLLKDVEDIIHVEVRKIHEGAELPTFEYEHPSDKVLEMTYRSKRPFADLCEGLILACIEHYGDPISTTRHDLSDDGTAAKFVMVKQ